MLKIFHLGSFHVIGFIRLIGGAVKYLDKKFKPSFLSFYISLILILLRHAGNGSWKERKSNFYRQKLSKISENKQSYEDYEVRNAI